MPNRVLDKYFEVYGQADKITPEAGEKGSFFQNIYKNIFAPFNWEFLKLGSLSFRNIRKNFLILQLGGSSPVPPTPPVFRLVLLHTEPFV